MRPNTVAEQLWMILIREADVHEIEVRQLSFTRLPDADGYILHLWYVSKHPELSLMLPRRYSRVFSGIELATRLVMHEFPVGYVVWTALNKIGELDAEELELVKTMRAYLGDPNA